MSRVQKSFIESTRGSLFIVATPIGNLQDITLRAIEVLKQVDIIAAEDTRHSARLCAEFDIETPLISYHKFNERSRTSQLISKLEQGMSIALISDAGTPTISDPGGHLVSEVIASGVPVIPVPGASATVSALSASGLATAPALFVGFLPRKSKNRKELLAQYVDLEATLVFYESPYRLIAMLTDVLDVLGDRQVAIARELTKRYEEWVRGSLLDALDTIGTSALQGEYTIVVEGGRGNLKLVSSEIYGEDDIIERVSLLLQGEDGLDLKQAIKIAAQEMNLSKRVVYNTYHKNRS